jgi:hypothetical protein
MPIRESICIIQQPNPIKGYGCCFCVKRLLRKRRLFTNQFCLQGQIPMGKEVGHGKIIGRKKISSEEQENASIFL